MLLEVTYFFGIGIFIIGRNLTMRRDFFSWSFFGFARRDVFDCILPFKGGECREPKNELLTVAKKGFEKVKKLEAIL